jgi:diguanylate cyclase (GGDEF)-like protein
MLLPELAEPPLRSALIHWIIGLSIFAQFVAAYFAFRLTRVAGWFAPGLLITLGLLAMGARRLLGWYRLDGADPEFLDLLAEALGLLVSILLLVGVSQLYPLLRNDRHHVKMLVALTNVDALTRLPNRRALDTLLESEWRRGSRYGCPLSAIMVDVDHFKAYNDTYGHTCGDAVLRQVARVIRKLARRAGDIPARFGGEEFLVVHAHTPPEIAILLAERIREEVEGLGIAHAASPTAAVVTVSLGVATVLPAVAGNPKALVDAADQALYRAKKAGRNRVEVAEPGAASGAALSELPARAP